MAAGFEQWLTTAALPLWWATGADHDRGGFREALTCQGEPADGDRRARVQARQVYVYAEAAGRGWPGPWLTAARHGMEYLISRYRRADGLYRFSVGGDGRPADERALLYEQAFVLLAMAHLARADPDLAWSMQRLAAELRERLLGWRHVEGGFHAQDEAHPFQANAHMHLLEAALACAEGFPDPDWRDLADEIAELALKRFVDPVRGVVREFFDAAWRPAAGATGRRIEPGHQFEWAGLLQRWGRLAADASAGHIAKRLYAAGLRGVDARGVAANAVDEDFRPIDPEARLWPQAEFLKAAAVFRRGEEVAVAARTLRGYLGTPVRGVWRDRLGPDGRFREENAPASSFYHIAGAITSLLDSPCGRRA